MFVKVPAEHTRCSSQQWLRRHLALVCVSRKEAHTLTAAAKAGPATGVCREERFRRLRRSELDDAAVDETVRPRGTAVACLLAPGAELVFQSTVENQ